MNAIAGLIKGLCALIAAAWPQRCSHKHPDGSDATYECEKAYAVKCKLCDYDRSVIW